MNKVADEDAIVYVKEKMQGRCNLPKDMSLDDDITGYLFSVHENWFTEDFSSFLCVQIMDSYISIPYAYSDMSFKNHKQLVNFAKNLYKRYTIKDKLPILYTGQRNYFPNHSKELGYKLWQLVAKD